MSADEVDRHARRNRERPDAGEIDRGTDSEERVAMAVRELHAWTGEQLERFNWPQRQRCGHDHVLGFVADGGVDQRPYAEPFVCDREAALVVGADREARMPLGSRRPEEEAGVMLVMAALILCAMILRGKDRRDRRGEDESQTPEEDASAPLLLHCVSLER